MCSLYLITSENTLNHFRYTLNRIINKWRLHTKEGKKTTPKLKQSIQLRNHGIYNKFFDSTTTFQLFENFRSAVEKKHLAIQTIETKVQKKNHEISAIFCRYLLLFSIFLNGIFNSIVIRIVLKRCLKYVGREKKTAPEWDYYPEPIASQQKKKVMEKEKAKKIAEIIRKI